MSLLVASTEDAESIFREVDALNMTSPSYVWIVAEQALLAPNKPDGEIPNIHSLRPAKRQHKK